MAFLKLSNCGFDGQESGLIAVVPLDICIANVADYQIFHLLNSTSANVTIGFDSYSTIDKCQEFVRNADQNALMQETFSNICLPGENSLRIEIFESVPPPVSDHNGYYFERFICFIYTLHYHYNF